MPKEYTVDQDDNSTYSTGEEQDPCTDSNSNSSFLQSRFDSLVEFHQWLTKGKHRTEPCLGATTAAVGSGESNRKTYIMEDISSSPLRRWRNLVDDDESPQPTKKYRRGCCNGGRRRTRSSSRDVYVSPKYIEPWIWKGTTRNPRHKFHTSSVKSDNDDGVGGGGESNTMKIFIVVIVIIVCLILVVKNKDRMAGLVKFGGRYFSSTDFNDVRVRVEGGVKDMIGSNFDDMSWKYNENVGENDDEDESFESAIEHNDPAVLKHIRSFEDQLKKKPSRFFPSGSGGTGSGYVGSGGSGNRNKSSQFWTSMLN